MRVRYRCLKRKTINKTEYIIKEYQNKCVNRIYDKNSISNGWAKDGFFSKCYGNECITIRVWSWRKCE